MRRPSPPGSTRGASATSGCAGPSTTLPRRLRRAGVGGVGLGRAALLRSRHGFVAPGEGEGDRDPVFTWPEGNAWLVQRLAAPLGERLLAGRTEAWQVDTVVLAVPLFVAARLLRAVAAALAEVVPRQVHAPWLVANLHLRAPLLQCVGAPPSWDNVVYGATDLGPWSAISG